MQMKSSWEKEMKREIWGMEKVFIHQPFFEIFLRNGIFSVVRLLLSLKCEKWIQLHHHNLLYLILPQIILLSRGYT